MSENTSIEWCDASINFWHGCTKVSAGCKNCYAETWDARKLYDKEKHFGKGVPRLNMLDSARRQALKLDRKAVKTGKRLRVFTNSMGDWLDDEVPIEWLAFLLETIAMTSNLDWLLLTKRPENFNKRLEAVYEKSSLHYADASSLAFSWRRCLYPVNVWVGTSVENQAMAEERIPKLLNIPAKVRFLSCEPLLSSLDLIGKDEQGSALHEYMDRSKIDWVIAGGESGHGSRPMHPDWPRSLRDQCQFARTPFFFKQWGEYFPMKVNDRLPGEPDNIIQTMVKVGKKKAGRLLDGEEWNQFPEVKGGSDA